MRPRRVYAPFESGLPAPTGRVYRHEIPGGRLSDLRQQAIALGLGEKFEQIEDMYAVANDILGRIPKVTPSSKVIGDLALALVGAGANPDEFAQNPRRRAPLGELLAQRRSRGVRTIFVTQPSLSGSMQVCPPRRSPSVAVKSPSGRCASTDEIANAIVFLASEQASYIQGVVLAVDGGRSAV
jgi:hypothetical protein